MKQGWEIKKLTEVVWFQEGPGVRKHQYTSSGVKLLNVANLVNGKVDLSTSDRYISSEEAYGKYKHFLVDEGDLILASSGIQVEYIEKKMGFIEKHHLPLCMNTSTIRFKSIDKNVLDITYFMYFLKSYCFKEQLFRLITGVAQLNYGPSHLKQMSIPVPPLPEQEKIVSELDCLSGIIEKKRQQLKELDALAQSIFYEMFGNPVENERGWEVKKIENLFKVTSSKRILQSEWQNEGVPFYKVADIVALSKGCNVKAVTFIKESTYNDLEISNLVPKEDDILITSRGTLGECYIVKKTDKFYFQDGMITWLTNKDRNISSVFVKVLFSNAIFLEYMIGVANSSTVAYLSIKQLSQLKLPLPPLPLQQSFAQKIEAIEQQKALIKQSIAEVETLFNARMQEYFE